MFAMFSFLVFSVQCLYPVNPCSPWFQFLALACFQSGVWFRQFLYVSLSSTTHLISCLKVRSNKYIIASDLQFK